ncbi:MAG: DUF3817 domain-containing protein [Planctomycetota bacterium]
MSTAGPQSDAIRRVRHIGLVEGASFLLLLGVAMPLKYVWGWPMAVKFVGWAHGLLFVLYGLATLQALRVCAWNWGRAFLILAASLVPFGPFMIDPRLKREELAAAK